MQKLCDSRGFRTVRIDGGTDVSKRQDVVNSFNHYGVGQVGGCNHYCVGQVGGCTMAWGPASGSGGTWLMQRSPSKGQVARTMAMG